MFKTAETLPFFHIDDLPYVPLAEHKTLPECAGLYFIRSLPEGMLDEMLYIGATKSLRRRLTFHNRLAQVFAYDPEAVIAWLPLPHAAPTLLQRYESEVLALYPSRMNGIGEKEPPLTALRKQRRPRESPDMQFFTVGVFRTARPPGKKPLYHAFVRDFSPHWEGCCLHTVQAKESDEAKKLAIVACKTHHTQLLRAHP